MVAKLVACTASKQGAAAQFVGGVPTATATKDGRCMASREARRGYWRTEIKRLFPQCDIHTCPFAHLFISMTSHHNPFCTTNTIVSTPAAREAMRPALASEAGWEVPFARAARFANAEPTNSEATKTN